MADDRSGIWKLPSEDDPSHYTMTGSAIACIHGRHSAQCVRCQQQRYHQQFPATFASSAYQLAPEQLGTSPLSSYQTAASFTNHTQQQQQRTNGWWIPRSTSGNSVTAAAVMPDAQLSKSPTSYMGTYNSSDDYNYFDVVFDDGSRQKRSVSLSTVPLYLDTNAANQYHPHHHPQQPMRREASETTLLLPKRKYEGAKMDSDDDSSDDGEEQPDRLFGLNKNPVVQRIYQWRKGLPHKQKMILKCSFAYFLGSLFTFVPFLNQIVGGTAISSHIVATVTVFFNPAKSMGGMVEAAGFGLLYGVLGLLVCLCSLACMDYLLVDHHMYLASCIVTLGVFVGGGTFLVAFLKAHLDKPSIRTASSLAFIVLFSVLIRETSASKPFDATKVELTFNVVIIGTIISVAVCYLVWPTRSTKKLKSDINATLESIRILLKLLTKTFLLDADLPDFTANKQLESAIKSHRSSFVALRSSLKEAKLEFYSLDMWRHSDGYDRTVSSLQRLAQHISGLRSSCGLQFEAMQEHQQHQRGKASAAAAPTPIPSATTKSQKQKMASSKIEPEAPIHVKADGRRRKMENELRREHSMVFYMDDDMMGESPSMERQVSNTSVLSNNNNGQHFPLDPVPETPGIEGGEGALVQFIRTIRPPMKSLAYTCKQTIIHIQAHFTGNITASTPSFELLKQNLTTALAVFEESEQRALMQLYRRKRKHKRARQQSWQQLQQQMDPRQLHSQLMQQFPAEDVFLVYFFVFCMVEFAKELMCLIEEVQAVFESDCDTMGFWAHCKEFFHLMFARASRPNDDLPEKHAAEEIFIPNNHNTTDTLQTPSPTTYIRKCFLQLWSFFSWFRNHTVRYAIKATLVSVGVAMLAFIPATQHYFREYRMEWTLITIMAVMSPTVGGTNIVAVLRVLATILGCIVAALVYTAFNGNVYLLMLCTWVFSLPCFHIILNHKHGRFGQFALLAYNLVVLYSYNHRDDLDVGDVYELAWKRCVAVSLGVIIGLVVTAYIWPYEARKELRKGLSDLLLHLSWLYKQLVSVYSETTSETDADAYSLLIEQMFYDTRTNNPDAPGTSSSSSGNGTTTGNMPTAAAMEALAARNKIRALRFQKVELALQVSLVTLRGLLTHAPNEPRLKGPFPVKMYESMLSSCQNILDKLLSMRIVILKDVWAIQVRRALMLPACKEWMDMAGNILLYFYLLASALQLKTPLPPYLPPAEKARQVLFDKLEEVLPSTSAASAQDESYMVFYAYLGMMEEVIQELDKLGENMKELYGTLVPADQWVRCFGLLEPMEQGSLDPAFVFNFDKKP